MTEVENIPTSSYTLSEFLFVSLVLYGPACCVMRPELTSAAAIKLPSLAHSEVRFYFANLIQSGPPTR